MLILIIILAILAAILISLPIIYSAYFKWINGAPIYTKYFDVTGKPFPDIDKYMSEFILKDNVEEELKEHQEKFEKWYKTTLERINGTDFEPMRKLQLEELKLRTNDNKAFYFVLRRRQGTTSYFTDLGTSILFHKGYKYIDEEKFFNYEELKEYIKELKDE